MRLRPALALSTAALTLVALTGCGQNAASDGPITLNYWAWSAESQSVVDVWNAANPDVQGKYTDAGGGNDSSAKLLTASRAGNAPDVALVEYTTLPRSWWAASPSRSPRGALRMRIRRRHPATAMARMIWPGTSSCQRPTTPRSRPHLSNRATCVTRVTRRCAGGAPPA
ncbi:hypothetical protein [Cryobacterium sp.]|uniref:hypothetical protein n=1 Tax=Cryobacterium sp. TaxID=1926290 RepID=UPI0026073087|nr:hypothetical protein [Cryobacterium sp.]MCU1446096.1 ABC-type sugar transporter periplasmic component [Cryobacterium sp.]